MKTPNILFAFVLLLTALLFSLTRELEMLYIYSIRINTQGHFHKGTVLPPLPRASGAPGNIHLGLADLKLQLKHAILLWKSQMVQQTTTATCFGLSVEPDCRSSHLAVLKSIYISMKKPLLCRQKEYVFNLSVHL